MKVRRTNGLRTPPHKLTRGVYVSVQCSIWLGSPCTARSWEPGACRDRTARQGIPLSYLLLNYPGCQSGRGPGSPPVRPAAGSGLTGQSPVPRRCCRTGTAHSSLAQSPSPRALLPAPSSPLSPSAARILSSWVAGLLAALLKGAGKEGERKQR